MTDALTSAQIRGARAMLDWSMVDLARAAGVSVATVKRIQDDAPGSMQIVALAGIRDAFQTAGIRFLDDDGGGPGLRFRIPCPPSSLTASVRYSS